MNNAKSNIDKITAKQSSNWKEKAKWREDNSLWLAKSKEIALKILRELRMKGLSQKELASQLSVTPQYINKIVKGQENLTLETISKIEDVLNIDLVTIPSYYSSIKMIVKHNLQWHTVTASSFDDSQMTKSKLESDKSIYDPVSNNDNKSKAA